MPYGAPVAHTAVNDQTTTATSASLNTTGASLLVVAVAYLATNYPTTPPAVSDNKGNTWHQLTAKLVTGGTRDGVVLFYAFNAIVGSGHTFTVSGGSSINGTFCVAAFPGARTSADPFDVQNGASSGVSDTGVSAGSVTPTLDGELVITAFCIDDPAGSTIACSGYTIIDTVDVTVGAQFGLSLAYQIQGSATATNPAWTRTTTNTQSGDAAVVATFAAAPSAVAFSPGTRRAPAKAGPFDQRGFILSPYQRYSYVPSFTLNAYSFSADPGTYAVTGAAAGLLRAAALPALAGSYALTGAADKLLVGHAVNAGTATYAINGVSATELRTLLLNAGTGAYVLSGLAATLQAPSPDHPLTVNPATYALSGASAATLRGLVTSVTGAYAFSGAVASFLIQRGVPDGPSSYNVNGLAATLIYSGSGPAARVPWQRMGMRIGL